MTSAKAAEARVLRQAATPEERILWQSLRGNRLFGLHFRRQQVIAGFIADFYCHAPSLVVEVDGSVHAERADYDAERDRVLAAHGLRILRVTDSEVADGLPGVLARIAVAAGIAVAGSPFPAGEGGKGVRSAQIRR